MVFRSERIEGRVMPSYLLLLLSGLLLVASPSCSFGDELEDLRGELQSLKKTVELLEHKVTLLEKERARSESSKSSAEMRVDDASLTQKISQEVTKRVQPALDAAKRASADQFNPAISVAVDQVFSSSEKNGANSEFRGAEVGLQANIDPFSKGYVFINGGESGVQVEEAALETTKLPYNLALKGGRFFADFGRLSKWHDHDLPFVNRPRVLDSYVGGEAQADGLEASYLVPVDQYVQVTLGGYNKVGAENDRVDNAKSRAMSEFSYLGKVTTSFSLDDSNTVDLSESVIITPRVQISGNANRALWDTELTYRYVPLDSAWYHGITWSTEVLTHSEKRSDGGNAPLFERKNATGLYSYVETKLSNPLRPGFLYEYTEDLDHTGIASKGYSPYISYWLSEFQRLRFQYTYLDKRGAAKDDNQIFLQWTAFLGSHSHGFRDR